jgi:YD repeat-containing protein
VPDNSSGARFDVQPFPFVAQTLRSIDAVRRICTVDSEVTSFGYDPVGQMTSVVLPDGASLAYTYDAAHRLTAIQNCRGNRIAYTLDAMGIGSMSSLPIRAERS